MTIYEATQQEYCDELAEENERIANSYDATQDYT